MLEDQEQISENNECHLQDNHSLDGSRKNRGEKKLGQFNTKSEYFDNWNKKFKWEFRMLLVLGGAICTSSQGPLSLTSYTAVLEVKSNEPTPFHRSAAALGWRKIMFIFLHQTVCSLLSILDGFFKACRTTNTFSTHQTIEKCRKLRAWGLSLI